MDARSVLGKFIRKVREQRGLSQEKLAVASDITYQYLSGLENGRENFTIGVLESLVTALGWRVPQFVGAAFAEVVAPDCPRINPKLFRRTVPLPPPMTFDHLEAALNETQRILHQISASLIATGARALPKYIQGNNYSGLVSNMLCDAFSQLTPFKHNSHQRYPDLIAEDPATKQQVGVEVKATIQIGKGGESHNGHGGWHVVACFQIDENNGAVEFIHIMMAILNGHAEPNSDWTYIGSKENAATGSRRTETYNTNATGTTKLRDGSVYLDGDKVKYQRWKQSRIGKCPEHSIFFKLTDPKLIRPIDR